MKKLLIILLTVLLYALPLSAQEQNWQKPVVKSCELSPGQECNVEVQCPNTHPFVVSGGGGIPKAMPEDNKVAITMNLPIAEDKWRVRWRNLSNTDSANIKVAVKILCTTK